MGYGALEERQGRPVHLGHGVLRADGELPLEQRLQGLFHALEAVMAEFRPEALAVEGVFTLRNVRSALVLGQARGVALLVAAQHGVPVHEYAPARVKKAVGAGGGADKTAVARMVSLALRTRVVARADATDALAVALCHLHAAPLQRLRGAGGPGRGSGFRERLVPAYRRFGA
jgi:crossover junction endodeoxyribonuclease RuvC